MKLYHASPVYMESPTMAFAQEQENKLMIGFGFYVSDEPSFCKPYGNGLFSMDLDLKKYENTPEQNNKIIQAAKYIAGLDIKEQFNRFLEEYPKSSGLSALNSIIPDQKLQSEILKETGVQILDHGKYKCIIDEKALPHNWTFEGLISDNLPGKPDNINPGDKTQGNFKQLSNHMLPDDSLSRAYIRTTNKQLLNIQAYIKQIASVLYTKDNFSQENQAEMIALNNKIGDFINDLIDGKQPSNLITELKQQIIQMNEDIEQANQNKKSNEMNNALSQIFSNDVELPPQKPVKEIDLNKKHTLEGLTKILENIDDFCHSRNSYINIATKNGNEKVMEDFIDKMLPSKDTTYKETMLKRFESYLKIASPESLGSMLSLLKDMPEKLYGMYSNSKDKTLNSIGPMEAASKYIESYMISGREDKSFLSQIPKNYNLQKFLSVAIPMDLMHNKALDQVKEKYGIDFKNKDTTLEASYSH